MRVRKFPSRKSEKINNEREHHMMPPKGFACFTFVLGNNGKRDPKFSGVEGDLRLEKGFPNSYMHDVSASQTGRTDFCDIRITRVKSMKAHQKWVFFKSYMSRRCKKSSFTTKTYSFPILDLRSRNPETLLFTYFSVTLTFGCFLRASRGQSCGRAKLGRFGGLAFDIRNRHFGGESSGY